MAGRGIVAPAVVFGHRCVECGRGCYVCTYVLRCLLSCAFLMCAWRASQLLLLGIDFASAGVQLPSACTCACAASFHGTCTAESGAEAECLCVLHVARVRVRLQQCTAVCCTAGLAWLLFSGTVAARLPLWQELYSCVAALSFPSCTMSHSYVLLS